MTTSFLPILLADTDHWDRPAWWPVFPLLWLLLLGALVAFVVLRGRQHRRLAGTELGESRLAERFASGEIDEQEYRQRLAVLEERR